MSRHAIIINKNSNLYKTIFIIFILTCSISKRYKSCNKRTNRFLTWYIWRPIRIYIWPPPFLIIFSSECNTIISWFFWACYFKMAMR